MKIGIVTQPLSKNYGGILQNYALQQFLKSLGHTPYTLEVGKFTWVDWIFSNAKILVKKLLGYKTRFIKFPNTKHKQVSPLRQFVATNIDSIVIANRRLSEDIVIQNNLGALIVGSDQVWRPRFNRYITDMFLGFADKLPVKRIAYAASFGTSQWEYTRRQTRKCGALAKTFNAISVREDSAVGLCKKYLNVDATHLLDPTLLLSASEYNKLLNDIPSKGASLLFAYILDVTEEKIQYVKLYSEKMGLTPIIKSAGDDIKPDDSIEEWLSYFRDSKYIITDSFHGMVFSIIYSKDFLLFPNAQRGADRFLSLLNTLQINDVIADMQHLDIDISPRNIDWNSVQICLDRQKIISKNFIINSLKDI